jgi:hypothetical protein
MSAAKDAIQQYLDKEYGEYSTELLTEPVSHYGAWIVVVVFGCDGSLVRMAFSNKPGLVEV